MKHNNGIKGDGKKPPRLMPVRQRKLDMYIHMCIL